MASAVVGQPSAMHGRPLLPDPPACFDSDPDSDPIKPEMSDTNLQELLDFDVLAELSVPEPPRAVHSLPKHLPRPSSTAAVRVKTESFDSPVQNESSISPPRAQEPQQTVISLQEAFATYVMCDFTPRSPSVLPMMRWVSVDRLLRHLRPHAPIEVFAHLTPDKLKHLITGWFQDHHVYAGLSFNEWCKRLKDRSDPLALPRSQAVHFPFEHTSLRQEKGVKRSHSRVS